MSYIKLFISLVAIAIQLAATNAFVSVSKNVNSIINGGSSHSVAYRSNSPPQLLSPVCNQLLVVSNTQRSATATPTAPAPTKKKEKKVTSDSDNETEKAKDRGWLVRLFNDVSYISIY